MIYIPYMGYLGNHTLLPGTSLQSLLFIMKSFNGFSPTQMLVLGFMAGCSLGPDLFYTLLLFYSLCSALSFDLVLHPSAAFPSCNHS